MRGKRHRVAWAALLLAALACSCKTMGSHGPSYKATYEQVEWFKGNSVLTGLSGSSYRSMQVLDWRGSGKRLFRAVLELTPEDVIYLTCKHPFFDAWQDPPVPADLWAKTVQLETGTFTPPRFVPNRASRQWWMYIAPVGDMQRVQRLYVIEFDESNNARLHYIYAWY